MDSKELARVSPHAERRTFSSCGPPYSSFKVPALPPLPYQESPMGNTDILSIQLYTLRSLGDLGRVLDTVQQAGYGHVETIGSHLDDAENVRAKLDARGLKVSSSHVSLAAVR